MNDPPQAAGNVATHLSSMYATEISKLGVMDILSLFVLNRGISVCGSSVQNSSFATGVNNELPNFK